MNDLVAGQQLELLISDGEVEGLFMVAERELVPVGVGHTVIGDAKEPRSIMDAISEAREAVDRVHAVVAG